MTLLWRRQATPSAGTPTEGPDDVAPPQPDHAWKALTLVVDWIKHAEAKAGALLAATGVSGGVLYNLVKTQENPSLGMNIAAGGAGALLFLAGLCAGLALKPRLWATEDPTSNLYYHHIARKHGRTTGSGAYAQAVLELTANGNDLVNEVAAQVWANAHVASDKYRWLNRGMAAFLTALPFLAATAVIITFGWDS